MQLQAAPQAVIFDLDGTLADTFPLIVAAWNVALREPLGRTYTPDEVVARFGIPDAAMLRRELQDLPPGAWDKALRDYYAHYEDAHAMVLPFAGVPEMLRDLGRRGLSLGVMTGKGRRPAEITLRALGWDDVFAAVVTGEDVKHQKPAPDGVLLAAQHMGVEARRCVYVGDSPVDIEAGRAAAMTTIAAAWHSYYGERLRASRPDFWASTPTEIVDLCLSSTTGEG